MRYEKYGVKFWLDALTTYLVQPVFTRRQVKLMVAEWVPLK